MNILNKTLLKLDGYLLSIQRNTKTSQYELEVGIPKNWVYKDNECVGLDIVHEADSGSIIRVFGKKNEFTIDDLINYVNIIIDTNKKIADKEKEFEEKLAKAKEELQAEVMLFQEEIDNMKESSFSNENKLETDAPAKPKKTKKNTDKDKEKLIEKLSS